jgi:tRNA-dihydrouridine synthase 2
MIGTTRRVNERLGTVEWTRLSNNGSAGPRPDQKESIIFQAHPEREGKQLIFQIGTSDPDRAVQAATLVAGDVRGIDVNAGCPKPFSTSGGMGAALLQTPDKLCSILEALVTEVGNKFEIGISVKIRLLETPEATESLVRKLCATGITGLTVHCRTTPMRPRERAIREQLKLIVGICHENGVACLMNGDVESRDHEAELINEYGADGCMIATAAETNPSCFRSKEGGGLAPWKEVVELYVRTCMDLENRFGNTKYLLGHLIPGKESTHRSMAETKSYTAICETLGFQHLIEQASKLDEALGLTPKPEGENGGKKKAKASKKLNPAAMAAGGITARARVLIKGQEHQKLSTRGVEKKQAEAPIAA